MGLSPDVWRRNDMVRIRVAAVAFGAAIAVVLAGSAIAQKGGDKKDAKGEVLKTITDVTVALSKDKKEATVTATGQVPTGGWTGAKLTPRVTTKAPADGIYEFELTAVKPTGIVTQVISEVKATHAWANPPADLKGVKVFGSGEGAKTAKVEK
jgi:phenylpyruvate tautomerase PptA (4-oxalocrotonate tautomerase family)